MIPLENLKRRIYRTIYLLDIAFGLLLIWTAYVYFVVRMNAQIYIGEHILDSDSQAGKIVQAITGLLISLVAEHYGRSTAALCRQLLHLILTLPSIRYESGPEEHDATTGSDQGLHQQEFELAVRTEDRR